MKIGSYRRGIMAAAFAAGILVLAPAVSAAAQTVDVKGVGYSVQGSLEDNLKGLVGRTVFVTTASGKQFSGTVKAVGNNLLHLERLDGKEYFDALIRLDRIDAVDTRFREPQR